MIRFAMLGSGSRGNATLIESGRTRVLVDCGFRIAETERRLARLGVAVDSLSAILVTHEHSDHLGGVGPFARRHRLPVWLTAGTLTAWSGAAVPVQKVSPHTAFSLGDLQIQPYPVPHDAREPCQYVFSDGARRLGLLSDAGSITQHMCDRLSGCDGLLLECNHDRTALRDGPYPAFLQARVGGDYGHLSNDQAAALLLRLDCRKLQHLALIHLSETNNTPQYARSAVAEALGCAPDWLQCADQEQGLAWCELR